MKKLQLLLFVFVSFWSCTVIKIETEFTLKSSYENVIKNKEYIVVFEEKNFCNYLFNDTIYALKGSELKQCISTTSKAIVYIWVPTCKNESCLSVGVVQEYCTKNGYDLFVVCTRYDTEIIKVQRKPLRPFFSINHLHHDSNLFGKSPASRFQLELIGREINEEHFLEFKNVDYIGNREIDKLIQ